MIVLLSTGWYACTPNRFIGKIAGRELIEDTVLQSAHIGISIVNAATGKSLYHYQGNKYFVPASNTKIFTCYAGLKYLGDSLPSIQYLENDTAVYVLPMGDPTLLHREFNYQPVISFLQQANKKIYLLDHHWKTMALGAGWSWDDYNDDYMVERSPMPVYGNVLRWIQERTGDAPTRENELDQSVSIYSLPEVNWKVRFNTDTSVKTFFVQRANAENVFSITQGKEKSKERNVPFVTRGLEAAVELLPDTLHQPVDLLKGDFPPGARWRLIKSQRTDSLLRSMMFNSNNFFAEQILLMISQLRFGIMKESMLIDSLLKHELAFKQQPVWVDGSGLSRYNLFTPENFTSVLMRMKNQFGMERLKKIFPTGGEGTLKNYYHEDSAYVFAKTGTLSGVLALSGYLFTKKQRVLVFSVLVNNHRGEAGAIRRKIEVFLSEIREQY